MPSGRRRQTNRRSRARARSRIGIFVAIFLILVVAASIAIVNRQMRGYFTVPGAPRATPVLPAPSVLSPPLASPSGATPIAGSGPKVAIIIDDCGYNLKRCEQFLALPIPITISILPMTPHGKQLAAEALAAGQSVMLHLPMEPNAATAHPGPGAIMTAMSDDQVRAQVEADLDSVPDVPGANNHMGSKATSDPRVMRDVLEVFRDHHLFFIDSMTSYATVGAATAHELGIPTARRDVFLDDSKDLAYIQGQFAQLQHVALKRGTAIAIGHPFDTTARALRESIPKLEEAGITFVAARTLVR